MRQIIERQELLCYSLQGPQAVDIVEAGQSLGHAAHVKAVVTRLSRVTCLPDRCRCTTRPGVQ